MTILVAENLACARGGRRLVFGLDVALGPGDALTLRGANGVGKTTALRTFAGYSPPDDGRLTVDGIDAAEDAELARTRRHFIGDRDPLRGAMTAGETALFFARALGAETPKKAAQDAMAAVGLEKLAALPCRALSKGQRRRLSLSRLFVAPRPLWILDEPADGLDADAQAALDAAIARHRDGGGAVALALHGDAGPPDAIQMRIGDA